MDPGTLAGIGLALAAVFGSMIMEGGNPAGILLPPAMMLAKVLPTCQVSPGGRTAIRRHRA